MNVLFESIVGVLEALVRLAGGTLAAVLPRRFWPDLEDCVPVNRSALLSGIVTAVAGASFAVYGYFNNFPLSVFAFAILTPEGWLSSYLWWTGLVRVASALGDEPCGDPLLTVLDSLIARKKTERQSAIEVDERRRLEGPRVRDQVLTGRRAGVPGASLVVLASRQKPGWRVGTTVVMGENWYRISRIDELQADGWLRTEYALVPHAQAEAARDIVYYDVLEPLSP